jgi:hypothetical protein
MIRIQDYSDEELTEELKERGFAVYKGEDMEQAIKKIDGLEKQLISKLNALKGGKRVITWCPI